MQFDKTTFESEIYVFCIMSFRGDSALFPVVMPSSRAMVMINNLGTGQKVSIVAEAVTDTGRLSFFLNLTLSFC